MLALAALVLGTVQAQATGALTLRFLDVGQGDAVLITSPEGKSILYDGGRSEARIQALLKGYGVQSLDLVAASHGDADHITGLVPAVRLFKPKFFLNNGIAPTSQTWGKLTAAVQQAGTQGLLARDQVINLGSVRVTVLPPPPGMPRDEQNVNSVGLLIQYGSFRALMTGDSETPETQAWLRKYPASVLGNIDVYKSIHHGAANGDHSAWLAVVQPKNVVIGVGPNNYGHPTSQALELYRRAGATVYRTDRQGTVTVVVQANGRFAITSEKGAPVPANQGTTSGAASHPATPASPVYRSCAQARAAGVTPLRRGQPGYSTSLDRDGDGIACE
nr:excalibur calcium-binding domain-containing protein [Deinococcus aestuarii]